MGYKKVTMKKKIYLIQPTYRNVDGCLLKGTSLFIHSLVLPILSATIPADWEKEFCLEYFEDINYETDASVVGISSMGYDLVHGSEIAEAFKKQGKIVIFGGYQAHFSSNRLYSVCDSIVFGNPGPNEMKKILGDIEAGDLAPEYHCGIDINFPFDYSVFSGKKIHFMPVLSSVGCRNECDFCCTAALYGGRYRLRNLNHVLTDLEMARRRTRYVGFVDSNIYNNREYLMRLCSRIIKENLNIRWGAESTIDVAEDLEVLNLLRQAGCGVLFIGLETSNQNSLDSVNKPYSTERYCELIQRIHRAGIFVAGYFILGLDGDTSSTFDTLFEFIHGTRINIPILNLLLPPPGTKVFDRLARQGRLLIKNEDEFILNNLYYNTSCNRCFFIPKHMSVEEAEVKFIDLNRRLCSLPEILWRSVAMRPSELAFLLYMNLAFRSDVKKMIAAHHNPYKKSG
jgi:radical SAM superfamily enzyme YgiQ (UPF0313 family)